MSDTKLPQIFSEATGECGQYDLDRPFAQAGTIYAGDRAIMVRLTGDTEPVLLDEYTSGSMRTPHVSTIRYWSGLYEAESTPLPDTGETQPATRCTECDGHGWREDEGMDCYCCEDGWVEDPKERESVEIGPDFWLRKKYIRMLARAGVREVYLPTCRDEGEDRPNPCRFVAPGFEGLVMPCEQGPA